jgi:hypothetical protein
MSHENPPQVDTQAELYHALTRPDGGYPVITREQWNRESEAQREWYANSTDRELRRNDNRPVMTPWDYLLMGTIEGIEYWLPNDETWFDIVAVDHTNRLAAYTGFCEMNDFEYADSDYRYQFDPFDNQIKCKFMLGRNAND